MVQHRASEHSSRNLCTSQICSKHSVEHGHVFLLYLHTSCDLIECACAEFCPGSASSSGWNQVDPLTCSSQDSTRGSYQSTLQRHRSQPTGAVMNNWCCSDWMEALLCLYFYMKAITVFFYGHLCSQETTKCTCYSFRGSLFALRRGCTNTLRPESSVKPYNLNQEPLVQKTTRRKNTSVHDNRGVSREKAIILSNMEDKREEIFPDSFLEGDPETAHNFPTSFERLTNPYGMIPRLTFYTYTLLVCRSAESEDVEVGLRVFHQHFYLMFFP